MKYTANIIFGKEQVNKFYNNESFTSEEKQNNIKRYNFCSQKELDAFCRGINEAIGWTECYLLDVTLD